jgi:HEAT repeat protein
MMHAWNEEPPIPVPGIAEEGAVRAAIERAHLRLRLLQSQDSRALRLLAKKPFDLPPPQTRKARTAPLAFGALVEAYFREIEIGAHDKSADRIVAELAAHLGTLKKPRGKSTSAVPVPALEATRAIMDRLDALPPVVEAYGALSEREEIMLALGELGDRQIVPELHTRALTSDPTAIEMLAAMGDRDAALRAADRLGAQQRVQPYDVAVVRSLVALDAREACPELRRLLEMSPLNGWRAGLEKGALVQELVRALGALGDTQAAPLLVTILESKSQEYRAVLPAAAFSLGQLRHEPALTALERIVLSPKDAGMCEAVWAIGEIGRAHPEARGRARALLDLVNGLEPGAEAIRLAALAKIGAPSKEKELRAAIDRALGEPGFRQDETSRRRAWAFRALEDLASVVKKRGGALSFDYDAVRHWVTRDDHRVRRAAERAFAAWEIPIPKARPYFAFALPDDIDGLLEALRDPLGIFKHNVARKLAALGDQRAVRPLAEATARLFAAPVTSTYEYDDAPPPLVAFVRALAKLNDKTYNGVLLDGLRSANHQVRAVVAENAPDDERFVPELMAMLGDSRSFLRSRAEKSLTSLGALEPPVEPATTELMAVPQRLQG